MKKANTERISNKYTLKAFYPNFYSDDLIAYVSLRIVKYFNDEDMNAEIMGISSDSSVDCFRRLDGKQEFSENRPLYRDAFPLFIWKFLNKILSAKQLKFIAEWRFYKQLKKDCLVYLWPSCSIWLYRKAKAMGCTIITEMINTMQSTSKAILDMEFSALNIPIKHGITDEAVAHDIEMAKLSDCIFSPSIGVSKSIIDAGIPPNKIIPTSYGLKKEEILNERKCDDGKRPFTFLFVGHICIRKGVHLLLSAWKESSIEAELKIVGRVSDEIKTLFGEYLKRCPSIRHIGFVKDLKPIYESADVFILPSLEEGSPLVTYLALGASLPAIVSPMGAGGVITDRKEGLVVDPHNHAQLIDAIRLMYSNSELRMRMSVASGSKAYQYTWEKVAMQRKQALLSFLLYNQKV